MLASQVQSDLHQRAKELYQLGQLNDAAQLFSDAIAERPTSELWNDWAAVQTSLGQLADAECGFRMALRLDPSFALAVENLGALLFARGRFAEAIPLLEQSLSAAPEESRVTIEEMLLRCQRPPSPAEPLAPPADLLAIEESANADPAVARPIVLPPKELSYEDWFTSIFRQRVPPPNSRIATSWPEDSHWGRRAFLALTQLEVEYATQLLAEIRDNNIEGDVAEFSVFEGWWINLLWQASEQLAMPRRIYGFDSFAGLSDPHPDYDQAFWKKDSMLALLTRLPRMSSSPLAPGSSWSKVTSPTAYAAPTLKWPENSRTCASIVTFTSRRWLACAISLLVLRMAQSSSSTTGRTCAA